MEQNPSWETNSSSVSQEILQNFWNPKIHYCIHKYQPIQSMTLHPTFSL